MNELLWNKLFYESNKNRNKNNSRFCHSLVSYTLPGSLTTINNPTSISIIRRPEVSLHKCWTPHFSRDITDKSVILPIGWPFCFRDNPNNNVLQTLLMTEWLRPQSDWMLCCLTGSRWSGLNWHTLHGSFSKGPKWEQQIGFLYWCESHSLWGSLCTEYLQTNSILYARLPSVRRLLYCPNLFIFLLFLPTLVEGLNGWMRYQSSSVDFCYMMKNCRIMLVFIWGVILQSFMSALDAHALSCKMSDGKVFTTRWGE